MKGKIIIGVLSCALVISFCESYINQNKYDDRIKTLKNNIETLEKEQETLEKEEQETLQEKNEKILSLENEIDELKSKLEICEEELDDECGTHGTANIKLTDGPSGE